jgi:hypothetical protein
MESHSLLWMCSALVFPSLLKRCFESTASRLPCSYSRRPCSLFLVQPCSFYKSGAATHYHEIENSQHLNFHSLPFQRVVALRNACTISARSSTFFLSPTSCKHLHSTCHSFSFPLSLPTLAIRKRRAP